MPIALFDMDGTLCDFAAAQERELLKLKSPGDLELTPNKNPKWLKARKRLIKQQSGFWRNLEPIVDGLLLMHLTRDLGFEQHILTKGPETTNSAWTEKKEWCDRHVPGIPVHISQDKTIVFGDVLVDDWPPYFLPWLERWTDSIAIAVAQPWNEDAKHTRLIRFTGDNLNEVRERLEGLAKTTLER